MKDYKLNITELSAILYYADFLSMQEQDIPVTDTCKYFYIHNVPMNICFIADTEPFYDEENQYFQQSLQEYLIIKNKFGDTGIESFIDNICNLKACGCVSGERMLKCIHQYSSKKRQEKAFSTYDNWKKNLSYKRIIKDEEGKPIIANCSKEIAHIENSKGIRIGSSILGNNNTLIETLEESTKRN